MRVPLLTWRKLRLVRALIFSSVYFLLYSIHALAFTVSTYAGTAEATYYFQHPFETLLLMFFELSRSPLLSLSLVKIVAQAFILGFITEWVYAFLRKRFRPSS